MHRRRRTVGPLLLVLVLTLVRSAAPASPSPLDEAVRLQREGKNRDAQRTLRALLPELRAARDREALARALTALTDASLALGDYEPALQHAGEAFDLHQQLGRRADAAWDLNAAGLANLYLARYDRALESYTRALELDRTANDGDGAATRLNNIGNVHFMRGRYADALRLYEDALRTVDTQLSQSAQPRLRKMSLSNLAALHQRLGADQRALDLYAQLRTGASMTPSEEAQLLLNQGALLRRLGDPLGAMERYREAQALFARAQHRDGEIGAWRNIGIACALDMGDEARALDAFGRALALARESSNPRGEVQALLYRGETLRRLGRGTEASRDLQASLDGARRVGLVEEQWKALYALGRLVEAEGRGDEARRSYEEALAAIESVRADLQTAALRSEFLADKRDVYDALITRRLSDPSATAAEVFALIERSRARTWQDRLRDGAPPLTLDAVQPRILPATRLLEYWSGTSASAVVWVSRSSAGIVRQAEGADDLDVVRRFSDAVSRPGDEWRAASSAAGRILLSGLPDWTGVTHLLVVPDGPLHFVPFEALTAPGDDGVLVDRLEISYLPSAAWLAYRDPPPVRRWMWPWQRTLLAFGDPPTAPARPEPASATEARPGLSHADDEVRGIAALLPGRAELHLGRAAQKPFLLRDAPGVPLLHFATHAIADARDPDRSRILLAPTAPGAAADHLFLREVYDLDLHGVQLATVSACATERGKVIRGEGVEGFSRALLAAGAASTVTTLWDVVDHASAELMKQFYFGLAQGRSEAAALREAKRRLLHSSLPWSHPRYWAGYVLNGDGGQRLPRVVPWSAVAGGPVLVALTAAVAGRRIRRRR